MKSKEMLFQGSKTDPTQMVRPSLHNLLDGPYPEHGYCWENNDLGITDEVPKPWTPIQYTPNQFSVWGRQYQIGEGILPLQITTQGKDIFTRPPALILNIDGKSISLGHPTINVKQDNHVTFTSRYTSQDFQVIADGSLEYDGLWKVQLRIEPLQKAVTIDELSLELPFKSNVAEAYSRYVDYDYLEQVVSLDDTANSYSELNKPVTLSFNPTIWIGNRQVGMEWICETDAGWSAVDSKQAIDIRTQGTTTLMSVKVVSKPLVINSSYDFTFALYPTPIKPLPKDWRLKRLVSDDTLPGGFDTKSLDVYSIIWAARTPVKYPGLPIMQGSDPKYFQETSLKPTRRFTDPEKHLRKTRQRIKNAGVKFIPYGSLNFMPATMPQGEWKHYASAWRTHLGQESDAQCCDDLMLGEKENFAAGKPFEGGGTNRTWGRAQGIADDGTLTILHVSPVAKSFHDFIVWQYVNAIEKEDIDGLYFDGGAPNVMAINPNIPYGDHVRQGGKYYPFFAERKLMQRLWVACKSRKPGFFITGHNPKMPAIISGFFDLSLTGEALAFSFRQGDNWTPTLAATDPDAFKPDYSIFPRTLFSHGFTHEAIGTINMLLPMTITGNTQLMKDNPNRLEKYTRNLFARTLAYNIPLYPIRMDLDLYDKVGTAYSHFDWLANAVFFGPRDSNQFLEHPASKLHVGLYLNTQRNQVLMVTSNLGKVTAQETLTLDIEALNRYGIVLSKAVEFVDPVNQTVLDLKPGNGSAQVRVSDNDFRMFIVR